MMLPLDKVWYVAIVIKHCCNVRTMKRDFQATLHVYLILPGSKMHINQHSDGAYKSTSKMHIHTVKQNNTEDPCYNDSVCYQRFCCKIKFAVIKKLNRTHLKHQ